MSGSPPDARGLRREVNALALVTAALCIALAWAGRTALNPDGVSYLDLAARMAAGDWGSAVQGYWSPLYPALLAVVIKVTNASGGNLLAWVHALNAVIALGCIALLRRLALTHGDAIIARGLFAVFLLCSARTPRIDAVTPDLLLLLAVIGIGAELLVHGARRWIVLGLWFATAFLAKTSSWPWLAVSAMILLVLGQRTMRRDLFRAMATMAAVMALWVVPLSLAAGRPTLGSAGRLNACWYLERCDSRTPDTHGGTHARVGALGLSDGETIALADFTGTPWTYLPWSDPTAWEAGVGTRSIAPLDLFDLVSYWVRQLLAVLAYWTPHILLGVLLPVALLTWRPGLWREGWDGDRRIGVVTLLGVLGVAQFVAVHAEPRLIAPFVMLAGMGVLWWLRPPGQTTLPRPRSARWVLTLSWLGFATALPRGVMHVVDLSIRAGVDARRMAGLLEVAKQSVPGGIAGRQLVVIGPAIPVTSDAWLLGSRIVAQIPPASAERIRGWPPAKQRELLELLGRGPGEIAWLSKLDGSFQMAIIPRSPR
jgi:hypothetical protein